MHGDLVALFTLRPSTLREQQRSRRLFLAGLTTIALLCGLGVWCAGQVNYVGHPYAFWLRLIPAVTTVLGALAYMTLLASDYRTERISAWAIAANAAIGGAPVIYPILRESAGLSARSATLATGLEALLVLVWLRRSVRHHAQEQLRRPNRPALGADLDAFILQSEHQGNLINQARGLIRRSMSLSRPDDLAQATDLLVRAAEELPADEALTLAGAAFDLVDAMDTKHSRSGDLTGYGEAMQVLWTAVSRLPAERETQAMVAYCNARYLLAQASRADEVARKALRSDAIRQLRYARHLSGSAPIADLSAMRGTLAEVAYSEGEMSAEEAVELCREGQRLAGWSRRRRAPSDLSLAQVLMARGEPPDVLLAIRLFRRVTRLPPGGSRIEAWAGLADAEAYANALGLRPRSDDRLAARWERAYLESRSGSPADVIWVGSNWVDWAQETGNPRLCARAYRALMEAVPLAAGPLYQRGTKDFLLAQVQARTEEAGWWMIRDGDPVGAVIALENGRAVAMREITGRADPAVESLLLEAGHTDLAARHRAAAHALDLAERDLLPGDRFTSALQRAAAEFGRVGREIDGLGLNAGDDLEQVRRATVEGPLVYLAAASSGGYALVVRGSGNPKLVEMPELTREAVAEQVASLENEEDGRRVERVAAWLWHAGMADLDRALGDGDLVTVVAVGLLGLLPVHIATIRDPSGAYRWCGLADRNDFRYAPSARILRTSQARTAALRAAPPSIVAVAAPEGDGEASLKHAAAEVSTVADVWGRRTDAVTVLPHATRDVVLDELPRHTVWHLACHGHAAPDEVLLSRVQLADGELTLRDLLRLPVGVRRLAVLSSCESHRIGHELPDEVVGLPGGMLQLGLAGVVAAHWEVNDRATALLMARFHELLAEHEPARALNLAQRWLRTATTAEMRERHPDLVGDRSTRFAHPYFWGAFTLTGA
ncbi:CHAT domain-containing protein [Micromonospora sp. WMMD1274]|uniref:CHAT domain-containing protein n=1 Tax=Micromonospora sp. WMMD1274 TaxID=3404116 RepID=UPI003B930720